MILPFWCSIHFGISFPFPWDVDITIRANNECGNVIPDLVGGHNPRIGP